MFTMKTSLLATFAILALLPSARANSVILIDVTTTPTSVVYALNNQPMSLPQLADSMKRAIAQFGDAEPILIRPDLRTTFATVFTLPENLKTAGVKHFEIIIEGNNTPGTTRRSLTVTADQVKHDSLPVVPPQ